MCHCVGTVQCVTVGTVQCVTVGTVQCVTVGTVQCVTVGIVQRVTHGTYCTVCHCRYRTVCHCRYRTVPYVTVGTVASYISGPYFPSFLWALGRNQPHIQRAPRPLTLAVKRPRRQALPRLHLAAKLRIRKLKFSSPYMPSWHYRDKFTFQNIA